MLKLWSLWLVGFCLFLSLWQPLILLTLELWGLVSRGNKVKEAPGSPRQLHAALGTVPKGKGV